ncbi:MAG: hypothetical protein ABI699_03950 [Caldimonas sp.]
MSMLVAGNSHLVGFKEAADARGAPFGYVPVPLCTNFEDAVKSGSGHFALETGWGNMKSAIGSKQVDLRYDFSQPERELTFVGMKLFGCFPIFGTLISPVMARLFPIWPCAGTGTIPAHRKYQIVSQSCLKQVFVAELGAAIAEYSWLFEKFDKVTWIPSPPPSEKFAESKFLPEHRWFIKSGLHAAYLSTFNECLERVNDSDPARSTGIRFVPHPMQCIDPETGFLRPEFARDPATPEDTHASAKYFQEVSALIAD